MGSTFRDFPKQHSRVISQSSYTKGRTYPVAAEDNFDDDTSNADELAEDDASLTDKSVAMPRRTAPRLPDVDLFDFEEACRARSLAHKFGPPVHESDLADWLDRKRRGLSRPEIRQATLRNAPQSSRRSFFWGFCTSLAIVIAVPAFLGFVLPLNSTPPTARGDNVVNTADTNSTNGPVSPAAAEVVAKDAESNETVVIRKQPAAAAVIGSAPTAFAAPLAPSAADKDRTRALAAVHTAAGDGDAPVAEPYVVDGARAVALPASEGGRAQLPAATAQAETVEPADGIAKQGAEASTTEPAPFDETGDDFARMAQSQLSTSADPSETEAIDAASENLVSGGEQQQAVSADHIDRLIARGETLLRSGNIVAARMLFLHIAAAGDARGAKAVGMTYDPKVYARLSVTGLTPDAAQAQLWYDKAGDGTEYTIELTAQAPAEPVDAEALAVRQRHAACARTYVSYDPDTGLYTAHSGTKRPCQLP